jgi:LPXTG-site transpeptidase (sortase) family protein
MTSGSGTCSVFYNQNGVPNFAAAPQVQEDVNATEGPVITSADNAFFDVGFSGSFSITATGNPSTMTIGLSGALPAGVNLTDNGNGTATLSGTPAVGTNGTYNLVLTANNGVLPNATQNFTLIVKTGPIVTPNGVNSVPDTGNGNISEGESIIDTLGITKITVEFSQDVNNPANDVDVKDVTNPANYLLVRSSSNVFQTVSCKAGPVAPDVTISVESVSYSNGGGSGPFVSTLSINGDFPLNVVGFYRLYVCGTTSIVDAINTDLVLAGNGTTPGTDFQRNFSIVSKVPTNNGGNGGGKNGGNGASSFDANGTLIPVTGFAPDQVTTLPVQPANKAYKPIKELRIEIPTLGINFPIVGVTLSGNKWDLTWLKDSVGYLEGSAYPTWSGNTVLTAHVIDANNNLGPFSDIKGMQSGQKIYIHFNRQVYVYQVQENSKILPSNISAVFKHEEDSWITLVTCEDYNAKAAVYNYRRLVRAVLISVIPEK